MTLAPFFLPPAPLWDTLKAPRPSRVTTSTYEHSALRPLLFPRFTFFGQTSRSVGTPRHRPSVRLTSERCNPVLDDPSHDVK